MSKTITIAHLYAKEMNIYGDNGNLLVLKKRLEWRNFKVQVVRVGVGDAFPKWVHLVLGGGGQDAGQQAIADDLQGKKAAIQYLAESGVPMLMICGMYQMFGKAFITAKGEKIPGIGVLNATTRASNERLIGNVVSKTKEGVLIGYENHSGRTKLEGDLLPFGTVPLGQGNNGSDGSEGARYKNVFGSYMHGPVLAKSPEFADYLLRLALDCAGSIEELVALDDSLENQAAIVAQQRPR